MSKLGELYDHSPRQVSQASVSPLSNRSAAVIIRPKVIAVKIQPELPVIARSSQIDKPGTISIFLKPKTNNFKPLKKSERILSAQKRVQNQQVYGQRSGARSARLRVDRLNSNDEEIATYQDPNNVNREVRQSLVSQEGLQQVQDSYREKILLREFEKHVRE